MAINNLNDTGQAGSSQLVFVPPTPIRHQSFIFRAFSYLKNFFVRLKNYFYPLKNDPNRVLAVVKKDGNLLKHAGYRARGNRDVVFAAMENNPYAFRFASPTLQTDEAFQKKLEEIVLPGNCSSIKAKSYFSLDQSIKNEIDYQIDRDLVKTELTKPFPVEVSQIIMDFSSKNSLDLWNEGNRTKKIVLEVVGENGLALEKATAPQKNDREIVLAAVKNNGLALKFASRGLKNTKGIVLAAVENYGLALRYANLDQRNDFNVALAAVQNFGFAIKFVSNPLKNNRIIALAAVNHIGEAFINVGRNAQNDEEIVLAAINNSSKTYYNETYRRKGQRGQSDQTHSWPQNDVIRAHIQNNVIAFGSASPRIRNIPKIVLAAVQNNGHALYYASNDLRNNEAVVLAAINENPFAYNHADNRVRSNLKVLLAAFNKGYPLQNFSQNNQIKIAHHLEAQHLS